MVAAPLVCFGLTHPEGHDFLGEAKQAAMLLLGVFLRPALMVIGLIAGMILSYVSLRILVYTFSGFANDLFASANSGASDGSILSAAGTLMSHAMNDSTGFTGYILCLLVFPLTLIIFTMLVYVVTTQCFSLIFALPDNILRWIGAPQQSSHSAEMARQVQGAIGGASGAFQKGQENYEQQQVAAKQLKQASQLARGGGQQGGGRAPR
jgi:defect-in-organelle-trafficking protein DotA